MMERLRYCHKCGKDLYNIDKSTRLVCNQCGEITKGIVSIEMLHCCRISEKQGFKFCPWCGRTTDHIHHDVDFYLDRLYIPLCAKCGKEIRSRQSIAKVKKNFEGGNTLNERLPWNYHWDGTCDHCGFRVEYQTKGSISIRKIKVRHSSENVFTFVDEGIYLEGIEIEVNQEGEYNKENNRLERVFLTADEMIDIMDYLSKSGSILLKQSNSYWDNT